MYVCMYVCMHAGGSKPLEQLIKLLSRIVVLSARTANCPANTRFLLQSMIAGNGSMEV